MRFGARKKKKEVEEVKINKYNANNAILTLATGSLVKVTKEQFKKFKETSYDETLHVLFDSYLEGRYYLDELLPLIKERSIIVEMQPKFTLLDKFEKEGIKHQAITYTPDFKVTYFTGKTMLIDVKGAEDQKFPLKRKMFDAKFPEFPPLVVMKYAKKFGGWITIEEYDKQKRAENKQKKLMEAEWNGQPRGEGPK
ncbi:hypothetical protein PAECIP111891_04223 [Paenibacillus allorhizoplanae]|uniref:DUF1064 domain-containing protein n=1 Tax=Paenibacillus allorhizoplanae TaxID=2905648 RepID=A0ABN8GT66_9BACL|nr:DUF1064 domain-containing protein [Paenibacillus allorhizoplanae]CAH1215178.1 hypothetical protein PAECIP111891_04223 [Paenibacillus allorhizoplanae]